MKNENILKLHQCLKDRRTAATKNELIKALDHCNERTLKRVIHELKYTHNAPIQYIRSEGGYRYTQENFELALPGLWLNTNTLLAIISAQHLLKHLNLDLLDKALATLQQQIERFLKQHRLAPDQSHRFRILPINARITQPAHYQQIAHALLTRTCLNITYHARGSDEITQRTVSPQRLAHYRDNWYLDAWCHLRNELRMFSLERIQHIEASTHPCLDVDESSLDETLASGYGIFSGNAKHIATLVFSPQRARWVADEIWHPKQQSTWLNDGRYQLHIPYSDPRELLMDIMRHLPEVEIVSPPELKHMLVQHLTTALQNHSS